MPRLGRQCKPRRRPFYWLFSFCENVVSLRGAKRPKCQLDNVVSAAKRYYKKITDANWKFLRKFCLGKEGRCGAGAELFSFYCLTPPNFPHQSRKVNQRNSFPRPELTSYFLPPFYGNLAHGNKINLFSLRLTSGVFFSSDSFWVCQKNRAKETCFVTSF